MHSTVGGFPVELTRIAGLGLWIVKRDGHIVKLDRIGNSLELLLTCLALRIWVAYFPLLPRHLKLLFRSLAAEDQRTNWPGHTSCV